VRARKGRGAGKKVAGKDWVDDRMGGTERAERRHKQARKRGGSVREGSGESARLEEPRVIGGKAPKQRALGRGSKEQTYPPGNVGGGSGGPGELKRWDGRSLERALGDTKTARQKHTEEWEGCKKARWRVGAGTAKKVHAGQTAKGGRRVQVEDTFGLKKWKGKMKTGVEEKRACEPEAPGGGGGRCQKGVAQKGFGRKRAEAGLRHKVCQGRARGAGGEGEHDQPTPRQGTWD